MTKKFTWERGPFEQCPSCNKVGLGFLSAGRDVITLRCTECRYSYSELLPAVDKATIYLDQFVFSALFKAKAGGRVPLGQASFYQELEPLLRRVVLLQQAILPHSELHTNETIVFSEASALREAIEDLGGDSVLKASRDVEMAQVYAYAKAFRDGEVPTIEFTPDSVLEGGRNDWLDHMRISVNMDYSQFAEGIRSDRESGFAALKGTVEWWAAEKPSFRDQLRRELQFGKHRRSGITTIFERMRLAEKRGDVDAYLSAALNPQWREFKMLRDMFRGEGTEVDAIRRVGEGD